jgi:flagellar motor protein MotB
MAKGGGGAWKVAYADFVTAMMAFFLVMWICGQDQKIRKAVSDYFGDPYAVKFGTSKSPNRQGSVFDALTTGPVPLAEGVAMGPKAKAPKPPRSEGPQLTKLVRHWLYADSESYEYWRQEAQSACQSLEESKDNTAERKNALKAATRQLSSRLKSKLREDIPPEAKGLYRDLLHDVIENVNWDEIAEDLLSHLDGQSVNTQKEVSKE